MLIAVVDSELLVEEGRAEEAKALLAAARTADGPRVIELALSRAENRHGIALASDGRSDEAAFAFKRACDLDASWAPPRANLGALWQRLGRPRQRSSNIAARSSSIRRIRSPASTSARSCGSAAISTAPRAPSPPR